MFVDVVIGWVELLYHDSIVVLCRVKGLDVGRDETVSWVVIIMSGAVL